MKQPVALTIAGSDPSGGAGVQADLKSFHQFGVYGEAVLTLLTVQNTVGVEAVRVLDPDFVLAQLDAVIRDIPPGAAKTGALGSEAMVLAVAERARAFNFPLVVDPVMISKHGAPLMDEGAREAVGMQLLPCAYLVTPNVPEAEVLSGLDIRNVEEAWAAAAAILDLGPKAVLLKGGHLEGESVDLLLWHGGKAEFPAERIATQHTHGTGCSYSAAITALLAQGLELEAAVGQAKQWIHEAIRTNPGLGHGQGPVNHFAKPGPLSSGN